MAFLNASRAPFSPVDIILIVYCGNTCVDCQFDPSRRGKKMLNYHSRDKKMKVHTVVGRGEEGLLCDPGFELLPGRERGSSASIK